MFSVEAALCGEIKSNKWNLSFFFRGDGLSFMAEHAVHRIAGIGIDMVSLDRFEKCLDRWGNKFCRKIFTAQELDICGRKSHRSQSLAARFAAKEAIMKALGSGWGRGIRWRDLSIIEEESGKPVFFLPDSNSIAASYLKEKTVHISLTHTPEFAAAFAVIEHFGEYK